MRRGKGGQGRPARLAFRGCASRTLHLSVCLALLVSIFTSLFGSRFAFYYHQWKQDIPRDLWARLHQRHLQGWQLADWTWTAGPAAGQKSYLLLFRHPLQQFADGLYQTEFRWPTAGGWGTWIDDEHDWRPAWSDPRWIDLDADGRAELVLSFNTGGNCFTCSNVLGVFSVRRDRLVPVDLGLNANQMVKEIRDLDGDGRPELVILGAELECFGHQGDENGLAYTRVFRWIREEGRFRDRSADFPDYYRDQWQRAMARTADSARSGSSTDQTPFALALQDSRNLAATAIYHWSVGQTDVGWRDYEERLAKLLDKVTGGGWVAAGSSVDVEPFLRERKQLSQLFFGREVPWATSPAITPVTARREGPAVR